MALRDGMSDIIKTEKKEGVGDFFTSILKILSEDAPKYATERANQLHQNKLVYYLYAVLDSCNSAYSMFKYAIELRYSDNKNPNLISEIIKSPIGFIAFIVVLMGLVLFSLLASILEHKNDQETHAVTQYWGRTRHLIKGLKNSFKGLKGILPIIKFFSQMDLKYLLMPVALGLGILAAANRWWLRCMTDKRKEYKLFNEKNLTEIERVSLDTSVSDELITVISGKPIPVDKVFADTLVSDTSTPAVKGLKLQTNNERYLAFVGVAANGLIDGLYLYTGILNLALLSPPLYIAMTVFSVVYTLSCVISRIYEEYKYQLDLQITATKCQLVFYSKKLEHAYDCLFKLNSTAKTDEEKRNYIIDIQDKLGTSSAEEFEKAHRELKKQLTLSYVTACLAGFRYGILSYGVVTATLFSISTLFFSSAIAIFSPLTLCVSIGSGVFVMALMAAYMISKKREMDRENDAAEGVSFEKLKEMQQKINKFTKDCSISEFNKTCQIKDEGKTQVFDEIKKARKFPKKVTEQIESITEVFRTFFSGAGKGYTFMSFIQIPLSRSNDAGNPSGFVSPVASMLRVLSALLFSLVFSLRSFTKSFYDKDSKSKKSNETDSTDIILNKLRTSPTDSSDSSVGSPREVGLVNNFSLRSGQFPPAVEVSVPISTQTSAQPSAQTNSLTPHRWSDYPALGPRM